jgi:hypothetical protein
MTPTRYCATPSRLAMQDRQPTLELWHSPSTDLERVLSPTGT